MTWGARSWMSLSLELQVGLSPFLSCICCHVLNNDELANKGRLDVNSVFLKAYTSIALHEWNIWIIMHWKRLLSSSQHRVDMRLPSEILFPHWRYQWIWICRRFSWAGASPRAHGGANQISRKNTSTEKYTIWVSSPNPDSKVLWCRASRATGHGQICH